MQPVLSAGKCATVPSAGKRALTLSRLVFVFAPDWFIKPNMFALIGQSTLHALYALHELYKPIKDLSNFKPK